MYPVPAPPSTSLPGELPLRAGEEEENQEKKPVLKKVMDKVKKIKKAISKKTPGHGNEGDAEDHHQHGDLDEGDEEYEEDEEIKADPAVHGVPTSESSAASVGIGAKEMSGGGGEGTQGAGDGLSLILEDQAMPMSYPETDTIIEQNRSSPNASIEHTREYESPATGGTSGAKNILGEGKEGADEVGDGLRLTTEKFVGDLAPPTNDARTNISQEYESPATSVRTAANEMSGGGREGDEGVGDGLGMIKEESVEDQAAPRNEVESNKGIEQSRGFPLYESPAAGARTGVNDISGDGGEGADRVNDGLGLIKEEFIEDPTPPTTDAEINKRNEQSRVYASPGCPATGATTEANEILGGVEVARGKGVNDFVKDPATPRTDERDTRNTRNEQSQVYESSAKGERTGANEMFVVEGPKGVDDGSSLITKDFVKDPATRTDEETDERIEQSQAVRLSPTTGARTGVNEMSGGEAEGADGVGDGLGLIPMALVEDPAAPQTEAETNTKTEQSPGTEVKVPKLLYFIKRLRGWTGGEVVEVSPELYRSLEAMAISTQNDKGETELSKDKNNSYTDMASSAASKVYGIVADAGTAVISKVKPDSGKDGEGEEVGKQGKEISIKEYITGKLTPGDDEKALSELITETGQKRKNAAVEVPPPEKTSSEEGGRRVGVVEKIRETVTSFLGVGESSPKSPATQAHRNVAEDNDEFLRRTPESISHEKRTTEELPSSYH